ncbi:DUF2971 domain-containing protein [Pectobacterium versatile]|uniref:DUF2971 domain-containing protein n=1 Tax=Pectobacterium versatile TaxID=2488639 RepID=UPI00102F1FB6|nr:DUF2971 domain-containing protein [Pectobacterium versatile]MBN3196507.1 DUF2971 domain-containing protein [Pectobacterium versatile]TAI93057.1 DUF2971 domain-containing protein [Pectobacterium versatile]
MSRFLYKYMTLREGFFTNPMIRATPAKHLNDPFEGSFNAQQVRDAQRNHQDYYRLQGEDVEGYADEYQINESMWLLQSDMDELGIISFTESFNNTLMWAHYGDEHKGLVVEFDFKEPFFSSSTQNVDGRAMRFKKDFMGTCFELPEKVDYRRDFPDFKRPEFSAPDDMKDFHWNKFYRSILFTKSIDWIYEQEQRSVVRLYDADSIICKGNEYIKEVCKRDSSIIIHELKDGKMQVTFPDEYEMDEEMGDQSIKMEVFRLVTDPQAMFFFKINPYAISSVYFGCKSNHHNALKEIINNEALSCLENIHKMTPDKGVYQFLPMKIDIR